MQNFESIVAGKVLSWVASKPRTADIDNRAWLLAVSGGADSMAMLHAIVRKFKNQPVIVAHMNHHARDGADADEAFVRDAAERLGAGFEAGHWRPERDSHFEADARQARYDWLTTLAERTNASAVMTAHTRDDQAETVLMRLARGTGPWGAAGIRPRRRLPNSPAWLVRPMLFVSRSSVVDYLNALGAAYRDDPTNFDTESQDRSWIRHVLVPQIENRLNPQFLDAVAQFAFLQQEQQAGLEHLIRRRANRLCVALCEPGSVLIDLCAFRRFGKPWLRRMLLRMLWADSGLSQRSMNWFDWFEIDESLGHGELPGKTCRYSLPGKIELTISGREAVIAPADLGSKAGSSETMERSYCRGSVAVELSCPGLVDMDEVRIVAEPSSQVPDVETLRQVAGRLAVLDAASLRPPVIVRRPVAGDRIDPIGMDGKRQKLVDYLRIRGVRGQDKAQVLVLEDRAGIVQVIGHGVSERAKVRPATESVWMIRAEPHEAAETKVTAL